MGPLVRLIGQGIGLAREAHASRKAARITIDEVPKEEAEKVGDFLHPPPC
jgi:hypothetical protein